MICQRVYPSRCREIGHGHRKRKRLTQLKLAEMVEIDRSHISAIELGNVGVSFDVIFRLCEVLETTPKQLFDFREE